MGWVRLAALCRNESGIGLIVALFLIVIVGLFGTLIARYAMIGATAAAEDYLWTQALYSAESAVQLRLLTHDGGNGPAFPLVIQGFGVPAPDPDSYSGRGIPATMRVRATRLNVRRTVEIKFVL
ncbi:MAG: hypothetical protein OEV91_06675 [Desulfobulbaceae bacterium]|nr:hypothetical protein [Desulfobulbaceae bacterium]HIJ91726.1 hypothetical protein [Deltaproteobacteria bacterium]